MLIVNHFIRVSLYEVFRVVVISSFGKLSALAAMVWTGDFYLWLPAVLVLPAHFQAYRGEIVLSLLRVRACAARGKAIGFVCLSVCLLSVSTKIARSGHLGL